MRSRTITVYALVHEILVSRFGHAHRPAAAHLARLGLQIAHGPHSLICQRFPSPSPPEQDQNILYCYLLTTTTTVYNRALLTLSASQLVLLCLSVGHRDGYNCIIAILRDLVNPTAVNPTTSSRLPVAETRGLYDFKLVLTSIVLLILPIGGSIVVPSLLVSAHRSPYPNLRRASRRTAEQVPPQRRLRQVSISPEHPLGQQANL